MGRTRTPLSDGRWFDASKATCYEEGRRWDGNNHISLATGSQWDHQELYRTAGGRWVLHEWSQWQGSGESYSPISAEEAAEWFVKNERDIPSELTPETEELDLDRGPGRPRTPGNPPGSDGNPILSLRLTPDIMEHVLARGGQSWVRGLILESMGR